MCSVGCCLLFIVVFQACIWRDLWVGRAFFEIKFMPSLVID